MGGEEKVNFSCKVDIMHQPLQHTCIYTCTHTLHFHGRRIDLDKVHPYLRCRKYRSSESTETLQLSHSQVASPLVGEATFLGDTRP